ncbi:MAG: alanine--tRNA ligase [Chloroflexi bacterium]|nr:alanine--tRNA ligase [Chloroflexota bacterium]
MRTDQIRKTFLNFFADRGHVVLPGSSLIPTGDPSVLLTTAGMQQFKAYFSGERPAPYPRVATVQKSFRTTDFDEVGDLSHLTFFEMLGSFSFNDYFKEEAIAYARDLVLYGVGIDPARIWVTVFEGREGVPRDDEAAEIWADVGHPRERIAFLGDDNFWPPTGDSGPCGPTTEIFVNLQPDEPDVGPGVAPERYLEIWNLVFNQYLQDTEGALSRSKPGVDTGAGLERWAWVLQDVASTYDTDVWRPMLGLVSGRAGRPYRPDDSAGRSMRIVAQHARAASFLIADGVMPGNEGRGYVLRRSLRHAVRHADLLQMGDDALSPLADLTVEIFGEAYPELERRYTFICDAIRDEEARFRRTLVTGMALLDEMLTDIPRGGTLPGARAFLLYDTYGFPRDVTQEVAEARGIALDDEGFEAALAEQRERSRAAQRGDRAARLPTGFGETVFLGYGGQTAGEGTVVGIDVDGTLQESVSAPGRAMVVLDQTPCYAEAGGQVGDTGVLRGDGFLARIRDTQGAPEGTLIHMVDITEGVMRVGDVVRAEVDGSRRRDIMRNHSATHLLHAALRRTLGGHVQQAGSLVAPDRLRFDFTHPNPVDRAQLRAIQQWVNGRVLEDLPVATETAEVREAVERGAMALFGEKYGEVVRVVAMGDRSLELCGGTHCTATSQIGMFAIASEGGIAAGVRRIEALTGHGAAEFVERQQDILNEVAEEAGVAPGESAERIRRLKSELAQARRQVAAAERAEARRSASALLADREQVDGLTLVAGQVTVANRDALRQVTESLRDQLEEPWVILLATSVAAKPAFVAAASAQAVDAGVHAGDLARTVAKLTGGGGGGRPELAMSGGTDATKIDEALDAGRGYVAAVRGAS